MGDFRGPVDMKDECVETTYPNDKWRFHCICVREWPYKCILLCFSHMSQAVVPRFSNGSLLVITLLISSWR